ncbi:MAG: NPCBM/NEW2 domain-containing protein [Abditibacteriota bacterium]|nr:NPCBM/NEW2 domain-containing protein [Abditibacteriota bacterium]
MKKTLYIILITLLTGAAFAAVVPTEVEMKTAETWRQAKFGGITPTVDFVGYTAIVNGDGLEIDSRSNKDLKIGSKTYNKGFYAHATTELLFGLPSPGKTFTAEIGVDDNNETAGGAGSVKFYVISGNETLFESNVFRGQQEAEKISVDLKGATSFRILVTDAGDGIASDQGDIALPTVLLENGKRIELSKTRRVPTPRDYVTADQPFSFVYDGKSSREILPTWNAETDVVTKGAVTTTTTVYTDPKTSLECRLETVTYSDFPVSEWTLYFTNKGSKPSAMLKNINAMDISLYSPVRPWQVHWDRGGIYTPNAFEPMLDSLDRAEKKRYAPRLGRASDEVSPYFNIATQDGGAIIAIGWPGQWEMNLETHETRLDITAGQEQLFGCLDPGETIRSPRMLILNYDGDYYRSQNLWRRFYMEHITPKVNGKKPGPMFNACAGTYTPVVEEFKKLGILPDYWWVDAGWYKNEGTWVNTGTWEFDTDRYPNEMKDMFSLTHKYGVKNILWLEPERVHNRGWLQDNHPEWITFDGTPGVGNGLLDMGNKDAREFILDRFDKIIKDNYVDLYREDFNMEPLPAWRRHDTPDKAGFFENHHIQGHLWLWDSLKDRNPGLRIDSCSSGGRRNDLETMRRAVPLLRTDYEWVGMNPAPNQCSMYGASFWLPIAGIGMYYNDRYGMRSTYGGSCTCPWELRRELEREHKPAIDPIYNKPWDRTLLKKTVAELRSINECYLGDYWPLTPYTLDLDAWLAWQFNLPEQNRGMIQVFKRENSPYLACRFKLRDLDPKATYEFVDLDKPGVMAKYTGNELMKKGIKIEIEKTREAKIYTYRVAP